MIVGSKKQMCNYFSDLTELNNFYPYKIVSLRIYYSVNSIEGIKVVYYSFKAK